MRAWMKALAGATNGVTPIHFWALDDGGGGPYADTGSVGGEDMQQVGTVTDDGTFGGISLSGAGAVAAADTGDVWDDVFCGSDKQWSIKGEVEFDSFGSVQQLFTRVGPSSGSPSFSMIIVSSTVIDFLWYTNVSGTEFRRIRKTISALSTGTTYKIALSYDGVVDTNNGLDRPTLFIDGAEYSFDSVFSSSGLLAAITPNGSPLGIGGRVNTGLSSTDINVSGNIRNVAVYDQLIDATEAGA